MQIVYEPHPVSPERKAELRAQGFKIVDARFAPEGFSNALQQQEKVEAETEAQASLAPALKRRGRSKKDAE